MNVSQLESGPAIVIVGAGMIGTLLAGHLGRTRTVALISARELLAGSAHRRVSALLAQNSALIFAHGTNVNVRFFARKYHDMLASRLRPLEIVARLIPHEACLSRAILISSTVALLPPRRPGSKDLVSLQLAFEQGFAERFRTTPRSVLRAGIVLDKRSQAYEGMLALRSTLLLKRLRLLAPTDLPWCDGLLLCRAVEGAMQESGCRERLVVHDSGLDLNSLLDDLCPTWPTMRVPQSFYSRIWLMLGVRPELFELSMSKLALCSQS